MIKLLLFDNDKLECEVCRQIMQVADWAYLVVENNEVIAVYCSECKKKEEE